jgi:hypothetical protein
MWLTFCYRVPCLVAVGTAENGQLLHWRIAAWQRVEDMALGKTLGRLFGRNLRCS